MLSTGTIEADGARLYFERRGDGSPLLLIPGGVGNSSTFGAVAGALAWDHTVLTYDRRGQRWPPPATARTRAAWT